MTYRFLLGLVVGALAWTVLALFSTAPAQAAKQRSVRTAKQETGVAKRKNQRPTKKRERRSVPKAPPFDQVKYEACVQLTWEIADSVFSRWASDSLRPAGWDEDYEYLTVRYLLAIKWDKWGCFADKDVRAAQRLNMSLEEYVIGGMHPLYRREVARLFRKLDELGHFPVITSGFRDDERQRDATGYKAGNCNSRHGGSCRTRGYRWGIAVDIKAGNERDGETPSQHYVVSEALWHEVDRLAHAGEYNLARLPGDPPHIEPTGTLEKLVATDGLRGRHKTERAKPNLSKAKQGGKHKPKKRRRT